MAGSKKVFTTLGSSNHVPEEREQFDYYATDPKAVELLLRMETFAPVIWEPACGEGHISRVLEAHGHEVISTDLIYRGYGDPEPLDFLQETLDGFEGDIITNPPYSVGLDFVKRALESVRPGGKVAMFLKVQFLEGQKRGEFFQESPPPNSLYFPFSAGLLQEWGYERKTGKRHCLCLVCMGKGFHRRSGDQMVQLKGCVKCA